MLSSGMSIVNYNASNQSLENLLLQSETGLRINKAADDASGMTIANNLRSQHLGLAQGTQNATNAKALMNIADGALTTYKDTLMSIKSKTIQASSDTESAESRKAIQNDINQLMKSLNDIAKNTSYNGIDLLNGTFNNKQFQVGAYSGQTVKISMSSVETSKIGSVVTNQGAASSTGTTAATLAINGSTIAATAVSATAKSGSDLVASAINDKTATTGVTATATNEIDGVGITASATLATGDILINGIAIDSVTLNANDESGSLVDAINKKTDQTGVTASINGNGSLKLSTDNGENIHITEANSGAAKAGLTVGTNYGKVSLSSDESISIANATAVSGLNVITAKTENLSSLKVTTLAEASTAIDIIDSALSDLNSIASDVGSVTNQLDRVITVNSVTEENLKSAESTIRDVDLAQLMDDFKKETIKNQASMFAMSQAAQLNQSILQLLR